MKTDQKLAARRVLVTGASSGIGAATCRSLAEAGAFVALVARRVERLEALKKELGERVVALPCDVVDFHALERTVDEAARLFGGLDAVISVAGRAMLGTIASGAPQGWRELFDLNLTAPLATVRFAARHFPQGGRRDIIFVGSTGAVTPLAGAGIYAASKRGLRAAFDALRLEMAPLGINVSLVLPGMFETEGLFSGVAFNGDLPEAEVAYLASGGPGSPETLTDAIAFMMSLPDGVCINELVMRPTAQLNP